MTSSELEPVGDLHIDDFCKDAAKIMILLYRRFPTKTTLYVEDISGPDQPDEFGLHSPRFEACFSAMIWLQETDYITFSHTMRQEGVEQATLTHRSFSLLSSLDEQFDQNTPPIRRIDVLKNQLDKATSEQLKETVLRLFSLSRQYS